MKAFTSEEYEKDRVAKIYSWHKPTKKPLPVFSEELMQACKARSEFCTSKRDLSLSFNDEQEIISELNCNVLVEAAIIYNQYRGSK